MPTPTCPVCHQPADDYCGCNPLACPVCGQIVDWFGENCGANPCKHVVAWGVFGDEAAYWEQRDYEALFRQFELGREEDDQPDLLEAFANQYHLVYLTHDDGGPQGHCIRAYFVFAQKEAR